MSCARNFEVSENAKSVMTNAYYYFSFSFSGYGYFRYKKLRELDTF